jgi:hypothetical protein
MFDMAVYKPDGYAVIKITVNDDTFFKVFSSWSGGYLHGDSYRLNSGISKLVVDEDMYYFHGFSGSVVEVDKHATRISAYNSGVLANFLDLLKEGCSELVNYEDIISELEANGVVVEYLDKE